MNVCTAVEFGTKCTKAVHGKSYCYVHYHLLRKYGNPMARCKAPKGTRSKDPLYKIWTHIYNRCYQQGHKQYDHYGGRGIRVHDSWNKDVVGWIAFDNFKRDVGDRPDGRHPSGKPLFTLDRINNDGNYEPKNVRWATYQMQNSNKRDNNINVGVCYDRSRKKWMARLDINGKTVFSKRTDSMEEAIILRKEAERTYLWT